MLFFDAHTTYVHPLNCNFIDTTTCGVCQLYQLMLRFDFSLSLSFVLSDLAEWFHASVSDASIAIMLTLAVRPIGALLFGAEWRRAGRRPILMLTLLFFTVFELLSARRPPSWQYIFLDFFRVMYGVAMGGIWARCAVTGDGNHSRSFAWPDVVGHFSGGLSLRLSVRPPSAIFGLFVYGRLARHVPDWRPACCLAALYYLGAGIPVWLAARARKEHHALLPRSAQTAEVVSVSGAGHGVL